VPGDDRDQYQQYVEDNRPQIMRDPAIAPQKKSRIMYASSTYLMEKLFDNPRADMIARTKKTVRTIVDLILSDEKTTRQLIRLTEFDYYTYTHSINVGIFSVAFTRSLLQGVSERTYHDLGLGYFFHDIGKAKLPPEILNKPGPLNEEEWKIMRTHPECGARLLEQSGLFNADTIGIVMQHHERPDGTGYPRGLRGDSIPVSSRICTLADVFDAMTTRRCYQAEFSAFEALTIIRDKVLTRETDREFYETFVRLFGPDTPVSM
jgi:HD-GYP domain-containing protein (c-di-GMP phosphodiesterase class II)